MSYFGRLRKKTSDSCRTFHGIWTSYWQFHCRWALRKTSFGGLNLSICSFCSQIVSENYTAPFTDKFDGFPRRGDMAHCDISHLNEKTFPRARVETRSENSFVKDCSSSNDVIRCATPQNYEICSVNRHGYLDIRISNISSDFQRIFYHSWLPWLRMYLYVQTQC